MNNITYINNKFVKHSNAKISVEDRGFLFADSIYELIGVFNDETKQILLNTINPQYIILKPSFIGGFKGSDTWISLAEKQNIGWWITSALESNVGLNGIAQYTYLKQNPMPQGLGTGSLFTNNITAPLQVKNGTLQYNTNLNWKFIF